MTPRTKRTLVILPLALVAGLVLVIHLSCTSHQALRVPGANIPADMERLVEGDEAYCMEVERHNVEEFEEFTLGFVELDDNGQFWDRRQVANVETAVRQAAARPGTDGVLTLVFVHGWKHDARVCDENVACFREILRSVENFEQVESDRFGVPPRRVVGVYVGWRGLSVSPPVLRELSFYSRKATAHRVGRGDVPELLTRLEVLRDEVRRGEGQRGKGGASQGERSKLVIVGHSFGGAVVFSALAELFEERLTRSVAARSGNSAAGGAAASDAANGDTPVPGFGDLVLLVNPAFEASLYQSLHYLSTMTEAYSNNQPAVLVTVTSESDTATKKAFPAGRFFSTLFRNTRDDVQKKSLTTTVGHYGPFQTHRLVPLEGSRGEGESFVLDDVREMSEAEARGAADCKCSYLDVQEEAVVDPFRTITALEQASTNEGIYGTTRLTRTADSSPPLNPFLVVSTTDEVVTKHNGIYNAMFINFLREFLLKMDARTAAGPTGPFE